MKKPLLPALMMTLFVATYASSSSFQLRSRVDPETKILFIGNSLTYFNDLPGLLEQFTDLAGKRTDIDQVTLSGVSLRRLSSNAGVLAKIAEKSWDFIILQSDDITAFPDMYDVELRAIQNIKDKIPDPKTQLVYCMNWSPKNGSIVTELNGEVFPYSYYEYQKKIYDGTQYVAHKKEMTIAPVGWAWQTVRREHPEMELYRSDGMHPGLRGSYLGACVYYGIIFQESTEELSFNAGLFDGEAEFLRKTASEMVLDNLARWNLSEAIPSCLILPHYNIEPNSWSTRLTLVNTSSSVQEVALSAFTESGQLDMFTTVCLPHGGGVSSELSKYFLPQLWSEKGWLKVEASSGQISGMLTLTNLEGKGTTSLPLVQDTGTRLVFPCIKNNEQWQGGFAITNVNDVQINLEIAARGLNGDLIKASSLTLLARHKFVSMAADFFDVPLPQKMILEISSTGMIAGFALSFSGDPKNIIAIPAFVYHDNEAAEKGE